jgi:protein-disulfide isomerase
MIEEQTPQAPLQKDSGTRATLLILGGGCALLGCAALAVILAAFYLGPQAGGILSEVNITLNGTVQPPQMGNVTPYPQQKANSMGDPNAPVKIIEYGDFQCPFCRRFWQQTEPQIIETYVKTGKVYFEYDSFAFLGPESTTAAEAAYCAGEQRKFWEYHDILFASGTGENVGDFTAEKLSRYAASIGLEADQFDACLTSEKYGAQVKQDMQAAKASGVHATPSFLINGRLVEGAQPFAAFQKIIDDILSSGSQNGMIYEEVIETDTGNRSVRLMDDLVLRAPAGG